MSLLINNALLMGTHYNYPSEALYTFAEANSKIINDGYIPVANADELNNLRTATTQKMGLKTPWQGTYTTGNNKKYIQVSHIDLKNYTNWAIINFIGTYDGNELNILNLIQSTTTATGIFSNSIGSHAQTLKNISIISADITSSSQETGYVSILIAQNAGLIENCFVSGSINSPENIANGGICGACQAGTIKNCISNVIMNTGRFSGGIAGTISTGIITNCYANVNITSTKQEIGGLVGTQQSGGIIEKSYSEGTIYNTTTNVYHGGIVGLNYGTINNSYSNVDINSNGDYRAGFVGRNMSGATITNCYSLGFINNVTNCGFCRLNQGTITNSYWDTVTSGQSTSSGGEGKTTTEMQEGSIPDTTIYVNWDNTIWDENTTNEYPTLK